MIDAISVAGKKKKKKDFSCSACKMLDSDSLRLYGNLITYSFAGPDFPESLAKQ